MEVRCGGAAVAACFPCANKVTIFLPSSPYSRRVVIQETRAKQPGEPEFAAQVLAELSRYFSIHEQVMGTHPSGKRLRVDAILVPNDRDKWKRKDVALCVEFKSPSNSRERRDVCQIISQCIDYSLVAWDGFGVQPIFFCPGFQEIRQIYADGVNSQDPAWSPSRFEHGKGYIMAGIMGQNNVGELFHLPHTGWAFYMNGHHCIWSTAGVGEGKLNSLTRKIGSR